MLMSTVLTWYYRMRFLAGGSGWCWVSIVLSVSKIEALRFGFCADSALVNVQNNPAKRSIGEVKVPHIFEPLFFNVSLRTIRTIILPVVKWRGQSIDNAKCILQQGALGITRWRKKVALGHTQYAKEAPQCKCNVTATYSTELSTWSRIDSQSCKKPCWDSSRRLR